MLLVTGIRIPLEEPDDSALERAAAQLGLKQSQIAEGRLYRLSYDARRAAVYKVCSVVLTLSDPAAERALRERHANVRVYEHAVPEPQVGNEPLRSRPVVAGFGPAGMFAAYLLAQYGYCPIVLERGGDIDTRAKRVSEFFTGGELDEQTNIQFGEGGAGAFSDGKLTTRIGDPLCRYVLETFVKHGAPSDILYKAKPHIGTDRLRPVVRAMREYIIRQGGEVLFHTPLDGITITGGRLRAVHQSDTRQAAEVLLLACGHSARDTFCMLRDAGLRLETKPFSVGVRIEHLQTDIDRALYGAAAGHPALPKGEYALSEKVGGRGVYTFCMCPGGTVVAAASERGGVVTNGMSRYARGGVNANSAVAVSVKTTDFADPFAAIEYQRALERAAFMAGGGGFWAPAQDVGSFLASRAGLKAGRIEPSYPRGVTGGDLASLLGGEIARCLRGGIVFFGKKLQGFDCPDAVLTGLETRTSSPIRVVREQGSRQAVGAEGLYPCGEGAGYAGGIMSAAVDGLKSALAIIARYRPMR